MNVGSLRGKDGEVVNIAAEWHLDFCTEHLRLV